MVGKMQSIVHPVNLLVDTEYERAAMIHGATFVNGHEGYGVIAEEVLEALDEMQDVERKLTAVLRSLRGEDRLNTIDWSEALGNSAISAAAELIQVAAMCKKLVKTMEDA